MGLLTCVLAIFCLVAVSPVGSASTWRDLDAGFVQDNRYLYLFAGDKTMRFSYGNYMALYDRDGFYVPADFGIQAAVMTLEHRRKMLFYGKDHGYFCKPTEDEMGTFQKPLKYGRSRAFLRKGGPDAAARRDGKIYVFKGCMMAQRKKWNSWGKPVDIAIDMNLPCDIHAAWQEIDGATVLVKGQQFWRWELNGTSSGPKLFIDHYRMGSWD